MIGMIDETNMTLLRVTTVILELDDIVWKLKNLLKEQETENDNYINGINNCIEVVQDRLLELKRKIGDV